MRQKTKLAALLCAMLIFMAQLLLPAAAAEKPWGLLLSPEGDMQEPVYADGVLGVDLYSVNHSFQNIGLRDFIL